MVPTKFEFRVLKCLNILTEPTKFSVKCCGGIYIHTQRHCGGYEYCQKSSIGFKSAFHKDVLHAKAHPLCLNKSKNSGYLYIFFLKQGAAGSTLATNSCMQSCSFCSNQLFSFALSCFVLKYHIALREEKFRLA